VRPDLFPCIQPILRSLVDDRIYYDTVLRVPLSNIYSQKKKNIVFATKNNTIICNIV